MARQTPTRGWRYIFAWPVALILLTVSTLPAEAQDLIFEDGFESGNTCSWDAVPGIEGVTPVEGTVGTEILIEGCLVGSSVPQQVFLGRDGSFFDLDLLDVQRDQILALLPTSPAPGSYDVTVVPGGGATDLVLPDSFTVRLPSDLGFDPQFVATGAVVTMTGSFLGSQPGQILITSKRDPSAGVLVPAVLSWQAGTGGAPDEVVFVIPPNLPANSFYDVQVTNGVGNVTAVDALVAIGVDDGDSEDVGMVSVVATSNTEVLVQFSEAVQGGLGGAENPAFYNISATIDTGDARTAVVDVLEAEVLRPDLSTLRLTTLSQSDLLYTLTVVNLRDLTGNPIAPPSFTTFFGIPPGGGEGVDSDGDGLSDSDEQRGWIVSVERTDGGTESRHVNSDPGDPRLDVDDPINVAARDTDGDGVTDDEEKSGGMDPRSSDTDGDTLTDSQEWNIIFSDPADQDTDDDGTDDAVELFTFRSSPILADTDGDQIDDTEEVLERNRDPRIADVPRVSITVGEVLLQIDERFTYEDTEGSTVTEESSSSSSLSQSDDTTFSTSNTDVTENVISAGVEAGFEGTTPTFKIEGSYQFTDSNTFQTDSASAVASQEVYEQSLQKTQEFDTTSTVTREIDGASIDVELTIKNEGDVAFAISDLEITVLQQSSLSTGVFLPVATLIASSTILTGEPTIFNLGPFTPERGPILFSNTEVFPNLVEELMKSPSGLIFNVANFSMTDELGREFTFANQITRDLTAGIIVDFGNGEVENFLVATALQANLDGFAAGEFVGGFNPDGSPIGIPLDFALQDILDLVKNAIVDDGIVAGPNQEADSSAEGDDIQLIPQGTTGIDVSSIVVSAGLDGVLDSTPQGDDETLVTTGYETSLTCSTDSDNAGEYCDDDSDCAGGATATCTGPEALVRFGSQRNGDFNRLWVILTTDDIPAGADFGSIVLQPGEDLFLAFVQDLDDDGLFAVAEYLAGSTDSSADLFDNDLFGEDFDEDDALSQIPDGVADSKDTDRDGLGDFAEINVGWSVSVDGALRQVFSSPRLRDSDGDGLEDPVEMDLRGFCAVDDPRIDGLCAFQTTGVVLQEDAVAILAGPNGTADTMADSADEQLISQGTNGLPYGTPVVGVGDVDGIQSALAGDDVYESLTNIPPASDPGLSDTDADEIDDAEELDGFLVSLSIRDGGNGVAETQKNGDDVQQAFVGNPVSPSGIIILPGPNGTIDTTNLQGDDIEDAGKMVVTDPLRRDTDNDLVPDGTELADGGDPTDPDDGEDFVDSDQDGLTDAEETVLGWLIDVTKNGVQTTNIQVNPNLSLPDTDFDGLPDFAERDLRTDPNDTDTDGDGLADFDEFADFERFIGLDEQFPRFSIDGSSSQQYGTDPTSDDSDGDGLTDFDELLVGYQLLLAGEQDFRQIFTNPLAADTDFDGVTDDVEQNGDPVTDATDPDTDDDGRTDGEESAAGTDPLVPDIGITIFYSNVQLTGGPTTGQWFWKLRVGLNGAFPGTTLVEPSNSFTSATLTETTCTDYREFGNLSRFSPSSSLALSFPLTAGEGFALAVNFGDWDSCDDTTLTSSCLMNDFKFFSYEDLTNSGFIGDVFIMTDGSCGVEIFYSIFVD